MTDTTDLPGTLSRRGLLRGLGLVGAATLGATACGDVSTGGGGSGAGEKVELTLFVFLGGDLGTMPREFVAEWQESHSNVVINLYEESNQVGYPKMVARKQTNPEQPLVNLGFFNGQTTEQGVLDQMWAPLDYAAMRNAPDILEDLRRPDQFGIGIGVDPIGLVHNTDQRPDPPTSWQELWSPDSRGEVVFFGFPWYAVYMAAKLNGGDENDMEPGWRIWQEQAENIRTLVESNPQYLNVMSSGTGQLTAYFNGTSHQWIGDGAPLAWVAPDEGAVSVPVLLQSVAGQSELQLEACQEIIDEMLSPKWCRRWAETSIEVPANQQVELPAELADLPAFAPENVAKLLNPDYAVVGAHQTEWTDRWNREIASRI